MLLLKLNLCVHMLLSETENFSAFSLLSFSARFRKCEVQHIKHAKNSVFGRVWAICERCACDSSRILTAKTVVHWGYNIWTNFEKNRFSLFNFLETSKIDDFTKCAPAWSAKMAFLAFVRTSVSDLCVLKLANSMLQSTYYTRRTFGLSLKSCELLHFRFHTPLKLQIFIFYSILLIWTYFAAVLTPVYVLERSSRRLKTL